METTIEMENEKKCVCPNCGADMKKSYECNESVYICEECGCTIQGDEQNFDTMGCCPNCNQPLDENECPYCGYGLGSDFE